MAYMNRFSQSDEGRRDELIRIIEHSVEKLTLAEKIVQFMPFSQFFVVPLHPKYKRMLLTVRLEESRETPKGE